MSEPARLRVHGLIADSAVNGPGRRAVAHLQGCTLGCPSCFNPASHPHAGGTWWAADDLADRLAADAVDGVTISGGEPFQQVAGLAALLAALRARGVDSIVVFTGYDLDELDRQDGAAAALEHIDLLVAGRYDPTQPVPGSITASANQRVHHLTARHAADGLGVEGDVEITIRPDGTVVMTGFPPAGLRRAVRRMGE